MNNVSNVLNYIDERVPINFKYENIKNRINVDMYIVKEKHKFNKKWIKICYTYI